ncbi:MAG: ATP-grasp fold amidoligase family protein [Caulobacteraceae bacterium]
MAKRLSIRLVRWLPDRAAISIDYFRVFGRFPDIAVPRRFSEKMQHLKLCARDPLMPEMVDKVRAKDFVRQRLGEDWVIPTLWHGEHVTENVLRDMPKPAIMKANHSSAQVSILTSNSDLRHAAQTANAWLDYDHHVLHREWVYGKVRREILIEPFIGEEDSPDDYKFWVFDGVVRLVQVDQGRFRRHTRQFYSPEWKRLDFKLKYPNTSENLAPPRHLAEMLHAARTLAADFRFLRVDLYDTTDKPLFGELTFAPEAGLCRFSPERIDEELGEAWPYPGPPVQQERPTRTASSTMA